MHKTIYLFLLSAFPVLFSNCATICGGSKYYAHIEVNNRSDAKIYYKGHMEGSGQAVVLVPRKDAGRFTFTIQQNGCAEQQFRFKSRSFRAWPLVGSLVMFSYTGPIVDFITGAYWKPNDYEKGVSQIDFKNFRYSVDYTGSCTPNANQTAGPVQKKELTTDVLYLKNGTIIKGSIIENVPNVQVQIRVADGDIILYKSSEIDRVSRETTEE